MSEKKIDKSVYSKRTLSTFSVVSAYLVDVYYNHLYVEARKMKDEGKTPTITEGYRTCCLLFAKSFDDKSPKYRKKQYFRVIEGIKEFFTTYTSMSTLTVGECIHKITSELVPEQFIKDLDNDKKSIIVRKCLVDGIMEFTKLVVVDFIKSIIDCHDDTTNIEALKDRMTDILLLEREKTQQMFLSSGKVSTVDRSLAIKLQNDLKRMAQLNHEMMTKLNETQRLLDARTKQVQDLLEKTKKAYNKYNGLKAEFDAMKEHNDNRIHVGEVNMDSREQYNEPHKQNNDQFQDSDDDPPIQDIVEEDPEELEQYLNNVKKSYKNKREEKKEEQDNDVQKRVVKKPVDETEAIADKFKNVSAPKVPKKSLGNAPALDDIW